MASVGARDPGVAIAYEGEDAAVRRPAHWHRELCRSAVGRCHPGRPPHKRCRRRRGGEDRVVRRPRGPARAGRGRGPVGAIQVIATITPFRRRAVRAGDPCAVGRPYGYIAWSGIRPLRGLPSAAKTSNDEAPERDGEGRIRRVPNGQRHRTQRRTSAGVAGCARADRNRRDVRRLTRFDDGPGSGRRGSEAPRRCSASCVAGRIPPVDAEQEPAPRRVRLDWGARQGVAAGVSGGLVGSGTAG